MSDEETTPMSDDRTIHLFREGSIITSCCHRAALDARISKDLGTYEPAAATCPGDAAEEVPGE